jgi:hypothetical protein
MSFFHNLNEKLKSIAATALPSQITEGKADKVATGFRAVADTAAKTYGNKPKAAAQRPARVTDEGNAFGGAVAKAKKDGVQPGEKINVGGKVYPVKETEMTPKQKSFAALAPPKNKVTFADKIAGAKSEVDEMLGDVAANAMKTAINKMHNKRNVVDETDDDDSFAAPKRRQVDSPRVGTVTHGAKHDVEEIPGGRRVTRRVDTSGYSVGSDTADAADEPRGRGRPKGPSKAPERTTAKAYKHKGTRNVKEDDVELADRGEYDQEGKAAKDDIKTVVRHAQALQRIIGDNDNLPEWVQSKLSKIEGMMTSIDDYMQNESGRQEEEISEKAVSKKQQKFMGQVRATQKGEKASSKEVAKVAKEMPKKAVKDFASTKQKGLPEKVKEEDNDTTAAKEEKPKKAKGGYAFGGSVYEALDAQLETLITEGMSVTVSMNQHQGVAGKNISIQADGEDADRLAELLRMSGMSEKEEVCPGCGQAECECDQTESDCGCGQSDCGCSSTTTVDENRLDWPTQQQTSNDAMQYAGGLNKPKSTGQSTTPVLASQMRRQASMDEGVQIERNLLSLYKNFKAK